MDTEWNGQVEMCNCNVLFCQCDVTMTSHADNILSRGLVGPTAMERIIKYFR